MSVNHYFVPSFAMAVTDYFIFPKLMQNFMPIYKTVCLMQSFYNSRICHPENFEGGY